jgi:hypothetical protein
LSTQNKGKKKMRTLTELKKNTSEITDNILEGNFDLYDYCHEQADSDQRVIYYYQAREYVLNHPDQSELEDEWQDLGFEFTDLSTLFTQLAFIGVRKEIETNCFEDINKDLAKFEHALNELNKLESSEETVEAVQELEEAIQELEEYV